MNEVRDATLAMMTPLGQPALCFLFGLKPQRITVELGADGVWSNLHDVSFKLWVHEDAPQEEHLDISLTPGKSLRTEVGGFELTIDGFEPMRGSLSVSKVIYWNDELRFPAGSVTVVDESLHQIPAA